MDGLKRRYDRKNLTEGANWTRFRNSVYVGEGSEAEIFMTNPVLESLE